MGTLYYGDNLDILRRYVADESVDLVYLDPPFNSAQNYNAFFQEKDGTAAAAQIQAFEDTWEWNSESQRAYEELELRGDKLGSVMRAFMEFLGPNDMMAYLAMMAPRLVELRRALKPTGSLYLHCDPTASHYLKLLLDAVFGKKCFVNEVVWKRTSAKSDHKQGATHLPRVHDVILRYQRDSEAPPTNRQLFTKYDEEYVRQKYPHTETDGRRYGLWDMTAPGGADPAKRNPHYEVMGVTKYWRFSEKRMQDMIAKGLVVQPSPGAIPRQKQYLDADAGVPIGDVWEDISPLNSQAKERLGYPTQKPVALLERIIAASSNPGDVVLDPFCGCGTTIDAAQKLGREWLGIDITHLAITLIKNRLADTYGAELKMKVIGEPEDLSGARELAAQDKYQFQWWALGLVGARPVEQKKGADGGVDGKVFFRDHPDAKAKPQVIIFSVKGGNLKLDDVRALDSVVKTQDAAIGVLLSIEEPTAKMKQWAATCGDYVSAFNQQKFPRIQLRTIEQLLAGVAIDRPSGNVAVDETFKRAPKAKAKGGEQQTFGM